MKSRAVLVTAGLTLAIDQATKIWALSALSDGPIEVVWKLRFLLVHNPGFAFSRGQGLGPLLGVLAVVIAVVLWRAKAKVDGLPALASIGLVVGGALGNLADRLFRGEAWLRGSVVDFIDFQFWPVFNVADMAIVVGVGMMMFFFSRLEREQRLPEQTDA
ncbi:MAG: signal peptidase II [Candidatus Poriferisodalaceae bacterium]|jgi:signal peptidase II